jgi:hypothetical protein
MDLVQFLEMIEQRQLALRIASKSLADEEDSPRRRQALADLEQEQRTLAEEIEPLKEKIEQTLSGPKAPGQRGAPQSAQGGQDAEKTKQAISVMKGWADEAHESMLKSADLIPGTPEEAPPVQKEIVDNLDRIYGAAAPYPTMLEKAIRTQQALVDTTIPLVETPEETGEVDFDEMAWPEERVSGWSEIIGYKAQEGLKNMPALDPGAQGGQAPPGTDPEEMKKQMEGLKKSMEKAVELCPKVQTLTREAAGSLKAKDAASALPNEEEALKLLKQIAEDLPKQDQGQQGDQSQQKNEPDEDQDQQNQQDRQDQQKPRKDLSREEAEALLQKAKERERKHREEQERLQQMVRRPGKVEKDW